MKIVNEGSIELVPIERLTEHPMNPRKGDMDAIQESIHENGFYGAVIAQRSTGYILVGSHRYRAAIREGATHVPTIYIDVDNDRALRILLADNRTNDRSGYHAEKLITLLQDLRLTDDKLAGTGYDGAALVELLQENQKRRAEERAAGEPEVDEIQEPPAVPVSIPGDLWLLGPHRVLCGDSTDPNATLRLFGANKPPLLMVTDPPYGVEYDPQWRVEYDGGGKHATGKVQGDDQVDWSPALKLFPGDVAYVWHAGVHAGTVAASIHSIGFDIRSQIIWSKQHFVFSRGAYHWKHEPCWYAVRKGQNANWMGDRTQTTIWEIANLNPHGGNKDEEQTGHGTQKPVEVMRRPIFNHTAKGDSVYDPFLGSGTTLVAAHVTGRICYGIDIDAKYCDVIVKRWQKLTGSQATLEGDDRTFQGVKSARQPTGRKR